MHEKSIIISVSIREKTSLNVSIDIRKVISNCIKLLPRVSLFMFRHINSDNPCLTGPITVYKHIKSGEAANESLKFTDASLYLSSRLEP